MKKIVIAFGCGLGNQMFQYAFYIKMQKKYPTCEIVVEDRWILPQQHNGFELDYVFGIELPRARRRDLKGFKRYIYLRKKGLFFVNVILKAIRTFFPNQYYYRQEKNTYYYENVFDMNSDNTYLLRGIWANEKYLDGIEKELKKAFVFQNKLDKENELILRKIESENLSVSIHIRRGDYVSEGVNLLDENYYRRAIKYIENICLFEPHFFVFSDDIDAARRLLLNITNRDCTFVEGNRGKDSWKDMLLMTHCKANIIANSTFSFWGAYLNKNSSPIIIAPNISIIDDENAFKMSDWISL